MSFIKNRKIVIVAIFLLFCVLGCAFGFAVSSIDELSLAVGTDYKIENQRIQSRGLSYINVLSNTLCAAFVKDGATTSFEKVEELSNELEAYNNYKGMITDNYVVSANSTKGGKARP